MICYKIILLEVINLNINLLNKTDEMIMAMVHYFITVEGYNPIMVKGVKDEVWLENLSAPYRIIRISSNYIHNTEQYNFDLRKLENIMKQIKRKTFSLKINTLNILTNVKEDIKFNSDNKNISSIVVNDLDNLVENKDIVTIFPDIQKKILKDKDGMELFMNVTNDINTKTVHDNEAYTKIFKPKKIIVTPILIFICVVMYLLMEMYGGSTNTYTLVRFGANHQSLILAGEVYRLFTSIFLHIGIVHLIVNMYSLGVIGSSLESLLGKVRFLIIFIVSGVVGSLLSSVLNTSISAGASGAIFGLLGSLLYFGYHYRLYLGNILKTQVIPIIVLNLVIGFMSPGIDNYAHIGGLIGGYLITMAIGVPGKSKTRDKINGWIVLSILIIFLSFLLIRMR